MKSQIPGLNTSAQAEQDYDTRGMPPEKGGEPFKRPLLGLSLCNHVSGISSLELSTALISMPLPEHRFRNPSQGREVLSVSMANSSRSRTDQGDRVGRARKALLEAEDLVYQFTYGPWLVKAQ